MRELRSERENYVTVIVSVIAILVIVGGYASFTGMAVEQDPLVIVMLDDEFRQSDVFDVDVVLNPVQFLADETVVVYLNNNPVGVIALKKYLDDNDIDYGTSVKNVGQNNVEVITLRNPLMINLADYVSLENFPADSSHVLRVEFSRGDAGAEEIFIVR